ncbi:hypothetical protein BBP40_007636 [Aspergillus hancockii]|nr:hypothetical protein BBP40_007636 [Aspergillus hancockii]
MATIKRPPFDPEIGPLLPDLDALLKIAAANPVTADDVLLPGLSHEEYTFTGPDGNELKISTFRKKQPGQLSPDGGDQGRPAIYHIHGGGMVMGNQFINISYPLKVVNEFDVICVSIDYRLAPKNPDPAPVEDCYAGLLWMVKNAEVLGIDPTRIVIHGYSAGGGLAAGVALLCRNRNGPKLLGQSLFSPMLDDKNDTLSAHQFAGIGMWDRERNFQGWNALLGSQRGTDDVSIYAAPSRAVDMTDLPPAYIDVGSTETFRDEAVAYAQKLWGDGIQCELHVWAGAWHGWDELCPDAALSVIAIKAKVDWFQRLITASLEK